MALFWKIWVDAKTEEKTLKLCDRILERIQRNAFDKEVEIYPKTNSFVVSFTIKLENERWNDAVVESIALGQRIGNGWIIGGNIYDDISCGTNRTNVSGIESIEWALRKNI